MPQNCHDEQAVIPLCGLCRSFIPSATGVGYCDEFAELTCSTDSCPSFVRFEPAIDEQTIDSLSDRIVQACIDAEQDPDYPIDRCGACQYFVSTPSDLPTGTCARHSDVVLSQDVACLNYQTVGGAA